MKKREADFQTVFGSYLKKKKMPGNYELKQTRTNTYAFSTDRKRLERQADSLMAAQQEGYYWKHSDADPREKICDCSYVQPQDGYIVIKYPGQFSIINVYDFQSEKKRSKSLSRSRAEEIAVVTVQCG